MLFSVKYIKTDIEDFQNILVYFFEQLGTDTHTVFSDDLFPVASKPKLYKNGNTLNGYKKFVEVFIDIFELYSSKNFSKANKKKLIADFFASNEIDVICDDLSMHPLHYEDMDKRVKKVALRFNSFYDTYFTDLVDKKKHFFDFGSENGKICPVCGMETSYQYDHFIPKGVKNPIYPLSCVNPRNLIPICQGCNGPKSSKLIIYQDGNRANPRLLTFSPYSDFETWKYLDFELINLTKPGVNTPGKWKVSFTLKDDTLGDDKKSKIDRWKIFYDIEDRFSKEIEKCIKIWIQEFKMKGLTFTEMVAETEPNTANIRRINGILLQNLLFQYIVANQDLMDLFIQEISTAQDPIELLSQQENN